MYASILSALFMGMVPVADLPSTTEQPVFNVDIAPPANDFDLVRPVSSSGVLIIDLTSGQHIFGLHEERRRPMASLTKLMTALIIVENHDLDEQVRIPVGMSKVIGNKAYLPEGEHFSVGDLLSTLLISSANDAAVTLSIFHSGSVDAFVEEMNLRADALGLLNTSFANPAGLDHPDQYSTPSDIAWLTMFSLRYPDIAKRMATRGSRVYSKEGTPVFSTHTHALIHGDKSVVAGKTGTTDGAKQCLVTIVEENGRKYLVVLFRSAQRYADMRTILNELVDRVL